MVRPTILNEARALHADLIERNPEGCRLPRQTFDKLIVMGYQKSREAADRILKTGEAAGLWTRHHDYATKTGFVEVHAAPASLPMIQGTSQTPQRVPA